MTKCFSATIPYPERYVEADCSITLDSGNKIVVGETCLKRLAEILSEEIFLLTGLCIGVKKDILVNDGDIILKIDPAMGENEYELNVDSTIRIKGGSYNSVAMATVTLLQSIDNINGISIPCFSIKDRPFSEYRGLLVDLARQWHDIHILKQMVILCRWYKIGYLQLHFTDDESFTFPSTAYPIFSTPGRHYTLNQLQDLERFAADRGIAIIPELETPSHSGCMARAMPQVMATDPFEDGVICPGREEVYKVLDTLIGEMCDVFPTTPYFHIGTDELLEPEKWSRCRVCQSYMEKHGIDSVKELYRHFIVRMNEIVKRHAKKTIVWEGFAKEGKIEIPKDVTVIVWESLYNLPQDVLASGYRVINSAWKPLYTCGDKMWSPEYIYHWNMYRWENHWEASKAFPDGIQVTPNDLVIGAQMCSWENTQEVELQNLRLRLPAMSERIWNPEAGRSFEDFMNRLNSTDSKLDKLVSQYLRTYRP